MKENNFYNETNALVETDPNYGSEFAYEGISTDLMPTLLGMYDAMYAKLSMADTHSNSQLETNKSQSFKGSPSELTDRSLYINEVDSTRGDSISDGSCESYSVTRKEDLSSSMDSARTSPLAESFRELLISEDRPLSSISSASSCSSNSAPRHTAGSYMASMESLEDSAILTEKTRRRDRKIIKARREKLRTGSSDSGVQCHSISLPAPSSLRRRYCEPDLSYMDRIVLEILETEEIYVRDLKEVIEGYLNYWKACPQPEIESDALNSLFSNIEEIYTFNRQFLTNLSICGTDPVCVARCFVRHNRGFAIYTDYCTNYPRTVSTLTNLMRREESMRSCRERQIALGHTLPLGSYLLKPVQRVLKYHLLLGNIIKNFPKDSLGYNDIWDALSAMTGMAHHINDMKRRHEHAVRVQEIQSLLYGWTGEDLTTFGELAAEGKFRTHGHKGIRHVFLFDKMLLITKKKDHNILVYKMHILCSNLMLIEAIPREPLSFHAIPFDNPRDQYTFECRSHEQKREWTQQLKRVILENYAADIPAHARQLVMELGQTKSDDLNNSEPRISRRAHHAPEYLEKRKDRRRASETGLKLNISPTRRKSKNRSSSCNRSSMRKISPSSLLPFEKKQLRLPLWMRRSDTADDISRKIATETTELSSRLQIDELSESYDTDHQFDSHDNTMTTDKENVNTHQPMESSPDKEENLHEIVTHLLQHRIEMQKKILNKQRRHIISKKQVSSCHASDTEDDRPPLPISSPPNEVLDMCTNNKWPREVNSTFSSTHSLLQSNGTECSKSGELNSNYDNVNDMWDALWSKFPAGDPVTTVANGLPLDKNNSLTDSPRSVEDCCENESAKTVVSTESAIDAYNILNNYLEQSKHGESSYKFPRKLSESNFAEYLYDSEEGSIEQIHPNHKIYKRLPLNKVNIRKILGRLASPRAHHKSHGELSSVCGRSIDSCSMTSTRTSIVSTVARHYSKALREKVRQITRDDSSKKVTGTNCIGARLASTHQQADYAVPNVRNVSGSRPDSVLSSSSFRTSSSTSSGLPQLKSLDETLTDSSTLGDSYYERCFDATEFEQELFRDSAIYSDPEDTDVSLSPLSSFRIKNVSRKLFPVKSTISRQSSFRHSYNFGSEISTIQRPKVSPPPVPSKLTQLDCPKSDSHPLIRLSGKLSRVSPLYNSVRVRPGSTGNCVSTKEGSLKNGWVKHIVDRLQDANE